MEPNEITVNDAIAAWLRAELSSPTESGKLRAVLDELRVEAAIIVSPDVGRDEDNRLRSLVFARYRGRETLFDSLDLEGLHWTRVHLSGKDLCDRLHTCRHHFERTYGTRDPGHIARVWNAEDRPNGVLKRLRRGEVLDPPILVATPLLDSFVILEGHNRIISYLRDLAPVHLPLAAIVGYSEEVTQWREWL